MSTDGSSHRTELRRGYSAILVAVILWGIGPLFVRAIAAPSTVIAMYRSWIVLPASLIVARVAGARVNARTVLVALPGGLFFSASLLFSFASFQATSLANATLITSMQPVLVVTLSAWLFGERMARAQLLFCTSALAGVVMVVLLGSDKGAATLRGDLLAALALGAAAGYLLCIKRSHLDGVGAASYLAGTSVVTVLVLTPYVLVTQGGPGSVRPSDWGWLTLLSLASGVAGHGLVMWAQRHVDIGVTSILMLGSTVVSAIGAWIWFDQRLKPLQLMGGALVLASLAAVMTTRLGADPLPPATLPPIEVLPGFQTGMDAPRNV